MFYYCIEDEVIELEELRGCNYFPESYFLYFFIEQLDSGNIITP